MTPQIGPHGGFSGDPKPALVSGTRPMGTGTPQMPPQNINPVRPGVAGIKKGGKVKRGNKK
jgi:hypothetical protein